MSTGICVTATSSVMKKSSTMKGMIIWHVEKHGPAVATGTIVTSAKSTSLAWVMWLPPPSPPPRRGLAEEKGSSEPPAPREFRTPEIDKAY